MIPLKEIVKKNSKWLPLGMAYVRGLVNAKSFFYLLLGIAVLILSANLGLPPLWGSEGRWAVIARSMLRYGDLLYPALGLESYWDKPLLSYWQILPFAYIHGGVSEFTARFPSVVWAVVMLFLTHQVATRWFGEQTALLSVGILTTTYFYVFWGRNAQVEMTNAAMTLLCLWYFLKHRSDPKHTWIYVFGIMMALGANMKGLVLYAVPVFCILLLSVIKREWAWIPPFRILVTASLLSIAVFLAVPAIASIHAGTWEPLHMVWRENVLRFFGLHDHKDPFYTYFIKIFYIAAPWSFLLPVAIIHCFQGLRRRLSQLPEAFILFSGIFLFFTLSGSRRPYYLLPILPFIAILVANMLREFAVGTVSRGIRVTVRVVGILLGMATVTLLGLSLVLPQIFPEDPSTFWVASLLLALLGVTMIASTIKKYVWGMVGSVTAVWLIYVIGVIPLIAEGPNLKTQIAQVSALGRPCGFLNIDNAKIIFYLDKPYQVFYDETHALDWAKREDGVLITSSVVSDQSWECIVKGKDWQAVIPRKGSFLSSQKLILQVYGRTKTGGSLITHHAIDDTSWDRVLYGYGKNWKAYTLKLMDDMDRNKDYRYRVR
jgi:4-amino-4-deoxy-L-arabinose transferase-like glycosyltransferase